MTLPSPNFVENSIKSAVEAKLHVRDEIRKQTHFVAYCKFCREGFCSDDELSQHRRNHERCPYDGCKFNASGKVVADHISRVHMKTNSLVKVQDLTTPEQIEKWREERRKRYPTTANVMLRQQAQEERFSRGEKLHERQQPRFGDFQQRNHIRDLDERSQQKRDQNHPRRNRHHNKNQHKKATREAKFNVDEGKSKVSDDTKNGLVQSLDAVKIEKSIVLKGPRDDSSDDEVPLTPRFSGTSKMKNYHAVEMIVKEHAALSILGMYGSDSDSDEGEENTAHSVALESQASLTRETVTASSAELADGEMIPLEYTPRDDNLLQAENEDDAPDEAPIEHKLVDDQPNQTIDKTSRKRKRDYRTRGADSLKPRRALDYSKLRKVPSVNPFLEKLLQEDIRHERNILLQCVNYVVRNNFFDVDQHVKTNETAVSKTLNEETLDYFEKTIASEAINDFFDVNASL